MFFHKYDILNVLIFREDNRWLKVKKLWKLYYKKKVAK